MLSPGNDNDDNDYDDNASHDIIDDDVTRSWLGVTTLGEYT